MCCILRKYVSFIPFCRKNDPGWNGFVLEEEETLLHIAKVQVPWFPVPRKRKVLSHLLFSVGLDGWFHGATTETICSEAPGGCLAASSNTWGMNSSYWQYHVLPFFHQISITTAVLSIMIIAGYVWICVFLLPDGMSLLFGLVFDLTCCRPCGAFASENTNHGHMWCQLWQKSATTDGFQVHKFDFTEWEQHKIQCMKLQSRMTLETSNGTKTSNSILSYPGSCCRQACFLVQLPGNGSRSTGTRGFCGWSCWY